MERETRVEDKNFSRFEINIRSQNSLPIYPLAFPEDDKTGVVIVGDYIAQDFTRKLQSTGSRDKWVVISTTQSDRIPTESTGVDFNFFTNKQGEADYLDSPARIIPYSMELGDGHYVDPDIFFPRPDVEKQWDILYPAKYYPTKKIELLLEAAKLNPRLQVAIVAWPVVSERKVQESREYREQVLEVASRLSNVTIFDNSLEEQHSHINVDGSLVIGKYSKTEMRDLFYTRSRSVVFLSETTEAINRACTEGLCCDLPILVAPTTGGLDRLVTDETGVMIERSPEGILGGFQHLNESKRLNPRSGFLSIYGKSNANKILQRIVRDVSQRTGKVVNWNGIREYGGDLWVPYDVYSQIVAS